MSDQAKALPRKKRDWWFWVAAFLLLVQGALFAIPHIAPGPAGLVCWMIGVDGMCWMVAALILLVLAVAWSFFRRPFWNRWRLLGLLMILGIALSPLAFRYYPSSHASEVSDVRFRLPLDGPILVGWGGDRLSGNYHVRYPDQRWAYDLLVANDRKTHRGDGTKFEDYYCYGLPVVAPADGEVVAVLDGMRDTPLGTAGVVTPAGGNQIVIKVAPGQFLFLCHLQRGSIAVRERDQVKQGQKLALVGIPGTRASLTCTFTCRTRPNCIWAKGYRCISTTIARAASSSSGECRREECRWRGRRGRSWSTRGSNYRCTRPLVLPPIRARTSLAVT